ncbi:hypothetical protein [Saccharothrix deserti]|uniref:hypothetical protein n=1 Tax=Saccharothrix deserti TaxID=2593674 RepID=UPI00192E38A8|nr:hypothetical protein [Saccharothrix deserti]
MVLVHGIAQQYKGPESLRATCAPALCDGVRLAGGALAPEDVSVAFYGDAFRPTGARSASLPDYDASDIVSLFEQELLRAWWQEAAAIDPNVPDPVKTTRTRTPNWVQRAVYALSGSRFFAGLAERAMIGALKQVSTYFIDPDARRNVQQRVLDAITPETTVVVAHSLGSVVAYEALCATRGTPVTTLVTLGSPLGLPNLVFDRLVPTPIDGRGAWPGAVRSWTNVADRGDVVANPKQLAPHFEHGVTDVPVHNGAKAHDMLPYLTTRETGKAVRHGLD